MVIIFRDFLIYQIFLSPEVKGKAIISNKHGIYIYAGLSLAKKLKTFLQN